MTIKLYLRNRRVFRRLLDVVAVYALFLPFYAPLLDHHFTERAPEHGHIYLSGTSVEHSHPYQVPHPHGEGTGAPSASESASGSEGEIIFLPPNEEGTPGSQGISFTPALLTSTSWLLIPPMLALLVAFRELGLRIFAPRLEPPPPRLAL